MWKTLIATFVNFYRSNHDPQDIDVVWVYGLCEEFNDNISEWDVSNVTDVSHMFQFTSFNDNITIFFEYCGDVV